MNKWSAGFKAIFRVSAIIALLLGLFYYLAGTQAGLNLIWSGARKMLPETIHVGSLEGTLLSKLVVKDFSYQDETVTASLHELQVNADLFALIAKRIVIHDIRLDGLRIAVKIAKNKPADESAPFEPETLMTWLKNTYVDHASIHDAEIKIAESVIRVNGSYQNEWQLEWAANMPELSHVLQDVHGTLVTSGEIKGNRYRPELHISIALDKFSAGKIAIKSLHGNVSTELHHRLRTESDLQVQGLNINRFLIPDFKLQLSGQYHNEKITQQAIITLSPINKITANIEFPQLKKADGINQIFKASAKVDVKDFLQFKTLFVDVPQVNQLAARISGAFTASGRLLHPTIDGGLQATQGSVYVPSVTTRLTDINLTARYHTGQPVGLDGNFTANRGTVHLSGTYGLEQAGLPLKLNIRGNDIFVKDTKEYLIRVSPDLNLSYIDNDLIINGKINVPEAIIQPVDISNSATLPSDVVIVNNATPVQSVPTNLSMRIQIVLGDRVKVKYRGLQTKLKGEVTIIGEEGNPLTAIGELGIAKDGTYRAYGKSLTIQQGRLIYTGNLLTNPGISLRATQKIKRVGFSGSSQFDESNFKSAYTGSDSLVVGIEAHGTLDKPLITLFSDPSGMSQGDILSYLLLGYPQSQASGASSLALLNVVSDMYGSGDKKSVVNNLQESLGLDELSVGSTEYYDARSMEVQSTNSTHSTTTVNVGRNLGRNLSVHYSVGIFQQIQVFSLRYQINRHLAVQTETSTLENGGDLLYQLESRD